MSLSLVFLQLGTSSCLPRSVLPIACLFALFCVCFFLSLLIIFLCVFLLGSWWSVYEQGSQILRLWPQLLDWVTATVSQLPDSRSLLGLKVMLEDSHKCSAIYYQLAVYHFFAYPFVTFTYHFEGDAFLVDKVYDGLMALGSGARGTYAALLFRPFVG
jgi:hypothetical protein